MEALKNKKWPIPWSNTSAETDRKSQVQRLRSWLHVVPWKEKHALTVLFLIMRGQSLINCVETEVSSNFSLCQMVHRTGSKISLSGEPPCCWQKCCRCRWSIGIRVFVVPSQVSKYLYIWETYSITLCQSGLSVLISSSMSCVRHNNNLGATDRGSLIPGGVIMTCKMTWKNCNIYSDEVADLFKITSSLLPFWGS